MDSRMMSAADLEQVTGKVRYSKQAAWFKNNFGIDVVRAANGVIVMPWATFTALNDRKAGLINGVAQKQPFELCFD